MLPKILLKGLLVISGLMTTIFSFSQANYDNQWKLVEKYQNDNLPKSALTTVESILTKSLMEKNTQQAIKAMIYKSEFNQEIDDSTKKNIFTDFQCLLSLPSTTAVEKALIHSLLAELYKDYYDSNSWTINQRTAIVGYVPKDMAEWSKNIFMSKIVEELKESLIEGNVLTQTKTEKYATLISLRKDSRTLFPTMYDFILHRAFDMLSEADNKEEFSQEISKYGISLTDLAKPASDFVKLNFGEADGLFIIQTLKFYQQQLASLQKRGMTNSIILTELNRIKYISDKSSEFRSKFMPNALFFLEKANEQNPFVIGVIAEIADLSTLSSSEKYDWLKKGISLYPNYERIGILKNKLAQMEEPNANFSENSTFYSNEKKQLILNYKNLNQVTVNIYKSTNNDSCKKIKEYTIQLPCENSYTNKSQQIPLDVNEIGNYYAEFAFDKKSVKNNWTDEKYHFTVTDLISMSKRIDDDKYSVFVTDRETGKPIANATVSVYKTDNNKNLLLEKFSTDKNGIAQFPIKDKEKYKAYTYRISYGQDVPDYYTNLNNYYYYRNTDDSNEKIEKVERVSILTDRSIYRPGQTVYFKLIATEGNNGEDTVLVNKSYEVKLLDANRQEVAKKTFTTNEFGSLAGEFVLPQGTLNGTFVISTSTGNAYIKVEEYKRPTFQVTFDKVDKTYKFDEEITLKGHAENFSGIKLQDADVHYTVTRQRLNLWRWFNSSGNGETQMDEQTVKTANDGSFNVSFIPKKEDDDADENSNKFFPFAYLFTVKATVTDLNGETQSQEYSIRVSNVSMILNTDLEGKYDKDVDNQIKVNATNLDGNEIRAKGTYTIYTLDENDSIATNVISGNFESGRQADLEKTLKKMPSGKYRIILKAKDDSNQDVEGKNDFILYSVTDKRPPYKTNNWLIEKNTKIAPDKPVEVVVGVSDKDVYVLYELTNGNTILEQKIVKLSDENRLFTLPYKKQYEENTAITFTLIRNGEMIQHRIEVTKPEKPKDLQLKFSVFRNKLRPGQKETWSITVKDGNGNPSLAEVLASMYDQSLDKIYHRNDWRINLSSQKSGLFAPSFGLDNSKRLVYENFNFPTNYLNVTPWDFDQFNWFGYDIAGTPSGRLFGIAAPNSVKIRGRAMAVSAEKSSNNVLNEVVVAGYSTVKHKDITGSISEEKPVSQIRTNFNETAFFYPQLHTNEKGETVISFTVPESNTTWKFRALAYDKSLETGQLEASVVTRKELMVTPNLPRFVRTGDKTSISTKISNLSDTTISGKVHVEFFNPLTDKVVNLSIADSVQSFDLAKDASSSASWTFIVPKDFDVLGCRIVAENTTFSDGEQHVIPVLPNKMLVTESLPLYIRGGQTKQFSFDHLLNDHSSTLDNERLTLEFSSNPAWYAVQALPTLSNPTNDDVISWFASYYANTLGSFIPKKYPRVAAMIEAWKQQGGTKETLYSALQKNEELKNVLLQETPWVLDAKDETEQKQNLSLLFDMNRAQVQTTAAIQKLKDLQTEQGGWSWFKGFYPNRSMTQYILYGFAELIDLNAVQYTSDIKQMQIKALNYLDSQIVSDFANLKKFDTNWTQLKSISTNQLEYLYVRSFYRDIPLSQEAHEAAAFYTSVIEKNWTNLNLYEESMLAVLAKQNGNKILMNKIMASLREHATTSDEMGMYWANNKSTTFFAQSAVGVHSFLMNAFRECGSTTEEMDNMKLWLLKQKQTEKWESTHGTLDAVYALLSNGSDWLASNGNVNIQLGKTKVNTSEKELGTGYIKQVWTKSAVNSSLGKVSLEKKDNGPAYGALYWQYFENLSKIESQSNKELNVSKMLFKEISSEKGKALQPITESDPLKVGDKVVVRLVVRADRDMGFVQLKDMRGACFEPVDQISGVKWNGGVLYYQTTKDASTNFYFDHLPKGTYTFEYGVYVVRTGEYQNGITSIQCLYAPEFVSHTEGISVTVK